MGPAAEQPAILHPSEAAVSPAPFRDPAFLKTEGARSTVRESRGFRGKPVGPAASVVNRLYLGPDLFKAIPYAMGAKADGIRDGHALAFAFSARAHGPVLPLFPGNQMIHATDYGDCCTHIYNDIMPRRSSSQSHEPGYPFLFRLMEKPVLRPLSLTSRVKNPVAGLLMRSRALSTRWDFPQPGGPVTRVFLPPILSDLSCPPQHIVKGAVGFETLKIRRDSLM